MRTAVFFSLFVAQAGFLSAAATGAWVPYTAHYTETTTVHDANGVVSETHKSYIEYRTADGTTARFNQVAGVSFRGRSGWVAAI